MTATEITPETSVGEIVAAQPLLARIFQKAGIDYCCGGKSTLATACAARGLDLRTFITVLTALPAADTSAAVNPATLSLSALADHIETTHHAYLKEELPVLVEQAERVAAKHGLRDGRMQA